MNHWYTLPLVETNSTEISEQIVYATESVEKTRHNLQQLASFFNLYDEYDPLLVDAHKLQAILKRGIDEESIVFGFSDVYDEFKKLTKQTYTYVALEYDSRVEVNEEVFTPLYQGKDEIKPLLVFSDFSVEYGFKTPPELLKHTIEQTEAFSVGLIVNPLSLYEPYRADLLIVNLRRFYFPYPWFLVFVRRGLYEENPRLTKLSRNITAKLFNPERVEYAYLWAALEQFTTFVKQVTENLKDIKTYQAKLHQQLKLSMQELLAGTLRVEQLNKAVEEFMYVLRIDDVTVEEFRRFIQNKPIRVAVSVSEATISLGLGLYNTSEDIEDFVAFFEEFLSYLSLR